jgi:dihydroflavonol-4-reductase
MQRKKSILVTGGTGLVGSHLLYSLTSGGDQPRAIFRKTSNRDFVRKVFGYYYDNSEELYESIEWIEADLLDKDDILNAIKGCDQVYHCAAIVSFESSQKEEMIRNNISGTSNIVSSCLESGNVKLCHVSSTAALGADNGRILINENHVWVDSNHRSSYAVSKHLSEELVRSSMKQGLNAVIVNPSVIFGPGDWSKGSSSLFSKIDRGMPFYTSGVTGYVDVRDVVKSMIILMNGPVKGERFIISSENLSFHEVFNLISKTLGVYKPFIPIPKLMLYPAMALIHISGSVAGKKSAINPDILRAAHSKIYFDNNKIIKSTGMRFMPVKTSVEDVVKIYIKEIKGNMVKASS